MSGSDREGRGLISSLDSTKVSTFKIRSQGLLLLGLLPDRLGLAFCSSVLVGDDNSEVGGIVFSANTVMMLERMAIAKHWKAMNFGLKRSSRFFFC
jgi:hypothetical protein